jgi:AcrR family transcriptional regulator
MDEKKQDKRVTKTQKLLVDTMLDLLQQKSFSKISVNVICEKAMVSHPLFMPITRTSLRF